MAALVEFFTDSLLRAPTIGAMLMCMVSGLVGVPLLLKKRTLLGEALSHASYPGVIVGALVAAFFFQPSDEASLFFILVGTFVFAFLGLLSVDFLEKKAKVSSDASLCFVLSSFFGLGVFFASRMQNVKPLWYKQVQVFLYGQAATLTDEHLFLYIFLSLFTLILILGYYHQIKIVYFDRNFAKSIGLKVKRIEFILFFLITLSVVMGIRSVGVVLMSGMLIAPAVAARMIAQKFSSFFFFAGLIGIASGFLGNYLSLNMKGAVVFPTGPMILIVASTFCLFFLYFAPQQGLIFKKLRAFRFRFTCLLENSLKAFWKSHSLTSSELKGKIHASRFLNFYVLKTLLKRKWIEKDKKVFFLTDTGKKKAARIIRLHRLWEVYLTKYVDVEVTKVHCNAEEMEHIITKDMERELTALLENPRVDPHHQPIPPLEVS